MINTSIHLSKRGYLVDIVTIDKHKFNFDLSKNIRFINFKNYFGINYRSSIDFSYGYIKIETNIKSL